MRRPPGCRLTYSMYECLKLFSRNAARSQVARHDVHSPTNGKCENLVWRFHQRCGILWILDIMPVMCKYVAARMGRFGGNSEWAKMSSGDHNMFNFAQNKSFSELYHICFVPYLISFINFKAKFYATIYGYPCMKNCFYGIHMKDGHPKVANAFSRFVIQILKLIANILDNIVFKICK